MTEHSPLTYRSLHLLAIVLFCLAGAHVAQAQILPLLPPLCMAALRSAALASTLAAALSPLH